MLRVTLTVIRKKQIAAKIKPSSPTPSPTPPTSKIKPIAKKAPAIMPLTKPSAIQPTPLPHDRTLCPLLQSASGGKSRICVSVCSFEVGFCSVISIQRKRSILSQICHRVLPSDFQRYFTIASHSQEEKVIGGMVTASPSTVPTASPILSPTPKPTWRPTRPPTMIPTPAPTVLPTLNPSDMLYIREAFVKKMYSLLKIESVSVKINF